MYKLIIYSIILILALTLTFIIFLGLDYNNDKIQDQIFIENISISEYKSLPKTRDNLRSIIQEDSISMVKVSEDKIEVFGSGYTGYDFYMWHKFDEPGSIYIKAFEISKNQILSEKTLIKRTMVFIEEKSSDYKLFKRSSTIYEGPLGKYYPVRFELWFKSKTSGINRKLAQTEYLIDGWDR